MIRKVLAVILVICLTVGFLPGIVHPVQAKASVKVGDYIEFGKYNNKPILWRVINLDSEGNPTLFSEKILAYKSFDVSGNYHPKINWNNEVWDNRQGHGSNYYKDSNIRQWLNSSETNIDWIQNDPSSENLIYGDDPYNMEKGFMADGNFTAEERAAIIPITHKVVLAEIDKDKAEGGTEKHRFTYDIRDSIENFNNAFFHYVTDSIFLLDVKELKEYIYDRGWDIKTTSTQEALDNSTYCTYYGIGTNIFMPYWLRTPAADYSVNVRCGSYKGYVSSTHATDDVSGVRPALVLNLSSVIFSSGLGTAEKPYIASTSVSQPIQYKDENKITAVPTSSKMTVNGAAVSFDAYNINSYNYFKLRDLAYVLNGSMKQFEVSWDNTKNTINITSGEAYTVVGGELSASSIVSNTANSTTSTIYINGEKVSLTIYNINGNNYFKLRDIAKAINFGVTWDEAQNSIIIDTTMGYSN